MKQLEDITARIKNSEIIDKNGYKYVILPLDIIAHPEEIRVISSALANLIKNTINIQDFDKIVTIESKGILISALIALKLNKPLYIIRKRSYKLKGEMRITKSTGYGNSEIYINGINENDRIILVDDLVSTGGTLKATLKTLTDLGCSVKGIFVIYDKYNMGGSKLISNLYTYPLKSLIKIDIKDDNEIEVIL